MRRTRHGIADIGDGAPHVPAEISEIRDMLKLFAIDATASPHFAAIPVDDEGTRDPPRRGAPKFGPIRYRL
jgi:hypothetical protein